MQTNYAISQPIGIEGSLGEIEDNWVRSYSNGTSIKKRYTLSLSGVGDLPYTVSIQSSAGITTTVVYNEGVAGTATSKRAGIAAAINASAASSYVVAYVNTGNTAVEIEARRSDVDFIVTEADANLTLALTTPFVAAQSVPFGVAVALSSQDTECRLPAAITDKIIGVSLFTHADQAWNGTPGYREQSVVSVLRRGVVLVRPETAVAAEDPVFVRCVATGFQKAGALRNSADGVTTVRLPASRFLTTASAGQLCYCAIDISVAQV